MAAGQPGEALLSDLIALGGAGIAVVELGGDVRWPDPGPGVVCVGVDRHGAPRIATPEAFDILLTTAPDAPQPWVSVDDVDEALARLRGEVERQPVAAAVAAQVLRATLRLSFADALALESLAYSMLLASGGFRAWRAATPIRQRPEAPSPRVLIEDDGGTLTVRLKRPAKRNAFDAAMRDALAEALAFALEHPDAPSVVLCGGGPAFSAGGDLDEFGRAADVGLAHLVRTLRSPAALTHRLGDRITARLHGACVGAGIEVPAAAGRVTAAPGTFFRLPEVSMGLIPGAGGTASIPRRVGRHRAAWMAISGVDIELPTAVAWGLVDAEEPA
jgi:Enoyl-CoA hydratase/isomerase